MPNDNLIVSASFTSNLNEDCGERVFALRRNMSGSCMVRRINQAATAGRIPIRNMPRQPISGSRNGITMAAASTPPCQPSPT